jgi:hypothetical protein
MTQSGEPSGDDLRSDTGAPSGVKEFGVEAIFCRTLGKECERIIRGRQVLSTEEKTVVVRGEPVQGYIVRMQAQDVEPLKVDQEMRQLDEE